MSLDVITATRRFFGAGMESALGGFVSSAVIRVPVLDLWVVRPALLQSFSGTLIVARRDWQLLVESGAP